MILRLLIISCLSLLTSVNIVGQFRLNYHNAVPSSPEVSSIAKFSDIPMNLSTGTPLINIPIYQVSSGDIDISIGLNYNASGIRVEEAATWVGLGWNLNTGPTLIRTVRGRPDDEAMGYMNVPSYYHARYIYGLPYDHPDRQNFEINIYPDGNIDLEPDIFSFSALGYSGKFYWDQDSSRFILSPHQHIKLEYNGNFILTLPNGVQCYFGTPQDEVHLSTYSANYLDGLISYSSAGPGPYKTSWSISKIQTPNSREINYNYVKDEMVVEFGRGGEALRPNYNLNQDSPPLEYHASFYKQTYNKTVLTSIIAENCEVIFKRNSSLRLDVVNEGKSLDTIQIKDRQGNELKSFLFSYDYFVSPDSVQLWGIESYAGIARKRLYLKAVQEGNIEHEYFLPPFQFKYNTTELPNRLSSSQDYWGFYNGKSNGLFLLPRIPHVTYIPGTEILLDSIPAGYSHGLADRRINSELGQARILKEITYPTGGSTKYTYESNAVPRIEYNIKAGIEQPDLIDRAYTFMPLLFADPPYPAYYSDTFRITRPLTKVQVIPHMASPCNPNYYTNDCKYSMTIRDYNTNAIKAQFGITAAFYIYLPEGKYKIECNYNGSVYDQPDFGAVLKWGESPDSLNFLAGGFRVKSIISKSGSSGILSRSFNYNHGASELSTGHLAGYPVHYFKIYDTSGRMRREFVSNSTIPLTSDARTVSYDKVTEYYDSVQTSYKTEYEFTRDMLQLQFGLFDGAPPMVKDWQNGHLRSKTVYELNSGNFRKVYEEQNSFIVENDFSDLFGLGGGMYLRPYYIATDWFLPSTNSVTHYSYSNVVPTIVSKSSQTYYNDFYQPRIQRTSNSKNLITDNIVYYPTDFNSISTFNITELKNKNIISVPIRQERIVDNKLVSGNIIKYNTEGLPIEILEHVNLGIGHSSHNPNVIADNNYSSKLLINYDVNSNLKRMTSLKDGISTYIYDWEILNGNKINFNPVAVIKNADSSEVAYTSFEASSNGNWIVSGIVNTQASVPTGLKCFNLSNTGMTMPSLDPNKIYIVTYWSKSGQYTISGSFNEYIGETIGDWTFYYHEVTDKQSVLIEGPGYIDEVRLYPKGASMITYSYIPSIGIQSQADQNNNIIYYEYDELNRLALVKDKSRNVVRKICYNYHGQMEDCGLGVSPVWKIIGSSCEISNGVNTGNLILEEKDVNPGSSTYNEIRTRTVPSTIDCPLPGSGIVCTGVDKKIINGICETGLKICVEEFRDSNNQWNHRYRYQWSDNSVSVLYTAAGLCGELEL